MRLNEKGGVCEKLSEANRRGICCEGLLCLQCSGEKRKLRSHLSPEGVEWLNIIVRHREKNAGRWGQVSCGSLRGAGCCSRTIWCGRRIRARRLRHGV